MTADVPALVAAANASLTDPERNRTIGGGEPRFELYYFALSLCSQKVRATLAEAGLSYVGHDINLSMPHLANYDPDYVRLRLAGGEGRDFAEGYTGRSSTDTEGFDPAVVPTLVDLDAGRVVVDSAHICRYLADAAPQAGLRPAELAEAVDEEVRIVDGTPHVAIFYGAHPDGDYRPARIQKGMPGVHARKIAKLETARARVAEDPALVAAYDAKIAKERAAERFVGAPDEMRAAAREVLDLVGALETRLDADGPWRFGEAFTLADVVWGVSLYRLAWLGMAFAWTGGHPLQAEPRPRVHAYAERLFARPTFREAVIRWPLTPESEHVARYR